MQNVKLLIVDGQESFVRPSNEYHMLPGGHLNLCVEGAQQDMDNLSLMIKRNKQKIKDIRATMDSHHKIHIASPIFWADRNGNHPNPFTVISAADVRNGVWRTAKPSLQSRALKYVEALETNGKYVLCVWPPHCIIGTAGHSIYAPLREALYEWEGIGNIVDFVTKGSNVLTEHYSGLEADVPDPNDPSTQLNVGLIQTLVDCDYLLIAGEALNFCVASTVGSIADNVSPDLVKKFVILEDATSAVKGFEHLTDKFIDNMKQKGAQFSTTTQFFA